MDLFIDTSNSYVIFGLFDTEEIVGQKIIQTNNNQAEIFLDKLDDFLMENSLSLKDISRFFFTNGPGSFTGVRVGLSFAKALSVSGDYQIFTISSLEVLLDNYDNSSSVIDARGKKYYFQKVDQGVFENPIILKEEDILFDSVNSYSNNKDHIVENAFNLIKMNRYSNNLEPVYLKEAF